MLGQQNMQEQLCISAEQDNRIGIGFLYCDKNTRMNNIKPTKPGISADADNDILLPQSIINRATRHSITK